MKIEKGDTASATSELKAALDDIKVRNKHIKLAVKNESWKVVEYKAEELADNADDEKRITAAVKAVATNKPINKGSKKGQFRSAPYHFPSGSTRSDTYILTWILIFVAILNKIDTILLSVVQVAPGESQPTDICFRCGDKGHCHWQSACPAQYRNFQTDKQNQ